MKKLFVVLKYAGGSRREQETRGVSMRTFKVSRHSPGSRGHSDLDFKNWGQPYQVFNPISKRKRRALASSYSFQPASGAPVGDLEIVLSRQAEYQVNSWTRLGVEWDQDIFLFHYEVRVRG